LYAARQESLSKHLDTTINMIMDGAQVNQTPEAASGPYHVPPSIDGYRPERKTGASSSSNIKSKQKNYGFADDGLVSRNMAAERQVSNMPPPIIITIIKKDSLMPVHQIGLHI
jgi:hypothetical protein